MRRACACASFVATKIRRERAGNAITLKPFKAPHEPRLMPRYSYAVTERGAVYQKPNAIPVEFQKLAVFGIETSTHRKIEKAVSKVLGKFASTQSIQIRMGRYRKVL